jgi:hypothetical protein
MLPVSTATLTGYYIHPNILTSPPHHQWVMSTGWDLRDAQPMRANNYGFAATRDFQPGQQAIGLVGDSYVEASMLAWTERPAAQLELALGGQRPVYALGGPGSSLLDYAERIRWAYDVLGIREFVVLMESTDASQVMCDSGNVHAHCLEPDGLAPVIRHRPPSGPIKDLVRRSALAQYLVSQLKLTPARLLSPEFWKSGGPHTHDSKMALHRQNMSAEDSSIPARQVAVIDAAVDEFQRAVGNLSGLQLVFVIDMNRRNLEVGRQDPDQSFRVEQRLRAAGYSIVRGEPYYREHLSRSSLRLDMGPHDAHLNATGVKLLMTAASELLRGQPAGSLSK